MFKNIFFTCMVLVFFTDTHVFAMTTPSSDLLDDMLSRHDQFWQLSANRASRMSSSFVAPSAESPVGASKFDELSDQTIETLLQAFGDFNITIPVEVQACDGKVAGVMKRTHSGGRKTMTISMDEKIMSIASYSRWICYQRAAEALLHQEGKDFSDEAAYLHACEKLLARGTTEDMYAILAGISRAFNCLFNDNDDRVLQMIFRYLTTAQCSISYAFEPLSGDRLRFAVSIKKMGSGACSERFEYACGASKREDLLKRV